MEEKKQKKQPAGAPGWIVTFADLMSLLLTFFILLLSFADTNVKKFRDVSGSLKDAFGVQTVAYFNRKPSSTDFIETTLSAGGKEWEQLTYDPSMMGIEFESFCALEKQQVDRERHSLMLIEDKIAKALKSNNVDNLAHIELDKNVLKIRFKYDGFFKKGTSDWVNDGLIRFAKLVHTLDNQNLDSNLTLSTFSPSQLDDQNISEWNLKSERSLTLLGLLKQRRFERIKKVEHQDLSARNFGEAMDSFEFRMRVAPSNY